MTYTLREQIYSAFFAALIAIFSQITIPLGVIPLTGQTLAVGFVVTFLGKRIGLLTIFLYLFLGLIGLPVFAGFKGGIGVLLGPTGGFLVGFLANAWVTGTIVEHKHFTYRWALSGNILGALATLLFGTCWLKFGTGMTWSGAFLGGFLPFIIPGVIKAFGAAYLGIYCRQRLFSKFLSKI